MSSLNSRPTGLSLSASSLRFATNSLGCFGTRQRCFDSGLRISFSSLGQSWRPSFVSGDRKWLESRRVGDLMRAATAATPIWNESEWRARLSLGPSARPERLAELAEREADRGCAHQHPQNRAGSQEHNEAGSEREL